MRYKIGFIILITAFLLSGCNYSQQWCKPGKTRIDFEQDYQECQIIAKEMFRQKTIDGKIRFFDNYQKYIHECLFIRGWTKGAINENVAEITFWKGKVTAFNRIIYIPESFSFINYENPKKCAGSEKSDFVFQGKDLIILKIITRRNMQLSLEKLNYSLSKSFFLYDKNRSSHKQDLLWAVFCGLQKDQWVVSLRAYLAANNKKQIAIIITKPIPQPQEKILSGLRLTGKQLKIIDQFIANWLPWIRQQGKPISKG